MKKPVLNSPFDRKRLSLDIQDKKAELEMSFRDISNKVKLNANTVVRAIQGENISIDYIVKLCNWLERPVQHYLTKTDKKDASKKRV